MNTRLFILLTFYIFVSACELNTWSHYKVAKQDTWITCLENEDRVYINKGDLCRFYSIQNHMSEVQCQSGINGQIDDWEIKKYFSDQ